MKNVFNQFKNAGAALASLVLIATLAGCGGGGEGAGTAAVASGVAASTTTLTPTTIKPTIYQGDAFVRPANLPRDTPRSAGATFAGNGWYYDAAAGGTGMVFEAQGDAGFVGMFMYEANGQPVWYVGGGTFVAEGSGYRFSGELRRYFNGQALNAPYRTPSSESVGNIAIVFSGTGAATKASTVLPGGRTWNMERFNFGALGSVPAPNQPEVGWYWNKNEGGRGYAIEIQGTQIFAVMFHYTPAGAPTWQLIMGDVSSGVMNSVPFSVFTGGQTLTGPYKPATQGQDGVVSLSFSRACDGNLMLPGASQWLGIERFTFGVAQPCKTAAAGNTWGGNLVTSVAEASYTFGSEERKAWNVLNAERSRCGFGLVSQNALLDKAAQNHLNYLVANASLGPISHTEIPGRTGFTGINPQDRTDAVGYRGVSTEGASGVSGGRDLQGSTRIRVLLTAPYHGLALIRGNREVGFAQGNGLFQHTSATAEGLAVQAAPGVRTWPCQGSVEAGFAGANEIPSPFPNEQGPIWGTPILVKGDGVVRIATASITGPDGVPVALKAIYGEGQTADPNARCTGDTSCVIPVQLAQKTIYQVRLTGTNGGQPLHPSGVLTFSFTTSGMLN